ncbi:predicted protein [Nematostella vectensis]|uniref:Pop1 N-terminal domain-containing protein n=1 Tax=Nematostella vectensis TaxID=45351 RepID=A7SA20_NEMVE|nr:predicted protein [Nematostella vectensis]|eukprot:XP_001631445.1 predicted protein [Nematostella vectensis]
MADQKPHVEQSSEVLSRKRKSPGVPSPSSASPSVTCVARGINVGEFAEARALELREMVRNMKEADGRTRKRIFQAPPKHMRRRAASHDVKRMPVRLREQAAKEMIPKTTTQKKSRRQRRKTSNLMEEYSRRQRQHMWLETHIWHAKRMKMVEKWGYRLAENPTDKSFKAAHRAVTHNCLLQDISYYCCTEVTGKHEDIVSAMKRITSPDTAPPNSHDYKESEEALLASCGDQQQLHITPPVHRGNLALAKKMVTIIAKKVTNLCFGFGSTLLVTMKLLMLLFVPVKRWLEQLLNKTTIQTLILLMDRTMRTLHKMPIGTKA